MISFYLLFMQSAISLGLKLDKNYMGKFMGLVDGDGYIEIGPQKQYNKSSLAPKSTIRARLVIRLHNKDKDLLVNLTKVLGVGSISNLDSISQTRLIFSKKDLVNVIVPLIKSYNLQFLTFNRVNQYSLLNYIIDNQIIHWENVKFNTNLVGGEAPSTSLTEGFNSPVAALGVESLLKLDFFVNWVVGFTIAEGSFGIKSDGSAFFSIKQKGLENYNIIKAICLLITGREARPIKADTADCYQLTLSSKLDVEKVVKFFFSPDNTLYGHKLLQYKQWLNALKMSNRYKNIKFPDQL
jgi:hypothetical protein